MSEKDPQRMSADGDRKLEAGSVSRNGTLSPNSETSTSSIHPAFYIGLWIALSSSVILFNKWVLSSREFSFPLFLTTWHMVFATFMTQALARFTRVLDSRHKVPMTTQTYMKAIVPIGLFFSFSLICGNLAYLYLSVSFIQMLKASNAVATLLATWAFGITPPDFRKLANVSAIVVGVVIASYGEIQFVMAGFLIQVAGIIFEAIRLVMVQRILSAPEFKMDPLVSLYYYAPACAAINGLFTVVIELPRLSMNDINRLGISTLLANAAVAFLLNVSVVFLIGKTSAVVLTLSGVLKDIMLVVASMALFGDPVTPIQAFGYSVALAGLVYYRLGSDQFKSLVVDARLSFGAARQKHPVRSRALLLLAVVATTALAAYIWWPSIPAHIKDNLKKRPFA